MDGAVDAGCSLTALIDERLRDDGPKLSHVSDVLARLPRASTSLLGDHAFRGRRLAAYMAHSAILQRDSQRMQTGLRRPDIRRGNGV